MANKKIGFYGKLESTANNKAENLYIIVNKIFNGSFVVL
jgi:hypothetical protein